MLMLLILAITGLLTGMISGGISAGVDGLIAGGSAGLMAGSFVWALIATVAQVRRERRLNRYFQQHDLWGE